MTVAAWVVEAGAVGDGEAVVAGAVVAPGVVVLVGRFRVTGAELLEHPAPSRTSAPRTGHQYRAAAIPSPVRSIAVHPNYCGAAGCRPVWAFSAGGSSSPTKTAPLSDGTYSLSPDD
jgi:hypothetical protein